MSAWMYNTADRVRALMIESGLTYREIANSSGLKERWVSKFVNGIILDPSVNKVERIYFALSGKSLMREDGTEYLTL